MNALTIKPRTPRSLALTDVDTPRPGDHEVLVQVLDVGLDGTDHGIVEGKHGAAPHGSDRLIIGHEALGRVVSVGAAVQRFRVGDLVVPTVRRPCGTHCPPCTAGQVDLCATGEYTERGIQGAHGYAAEWFVEDEQWLIAVPGALREVAVLTEPMSIALKGIERAWAFQSTFAWRPQKALILGAGSLGILATSLLRLRGLATVTVDHATGDSAKAQLIGSLDGTYVTTTDAQLVDLLGAHLPLDFVFEATGVSSLIFQAMCVLGANGVLCVAGLPEADQTAEIPADCVGLEMVMENRIFFGTVSSNRGHFERAVDAIGAITRGFPGVLEGIITARFPLAEYERALRKPVVKNVLALQA